MSRSKSAHDLSGLMKYADRAPWDEALAEMLSAHLDPASEATGLEPDAIFEIIGDHWQGPLWGCAFEDLLTQELEPDGRNLVADYLKRRGWTEKAPNKAYMRALRSEEHTSELQSLMRISYAVFCLEKNKKYPLQHTPIINLLYQHSIQIIIVNFVMLMAFTTLLTYLFII